MVTVTLSQHLCPPLSFLFSYLSPPQFQIHPTPNPSSSPSFTSATSTGQAHPPKEVKIIFDLVRSIRYVQTIGNVGFQILMNCDTSSPGPTSPSTPYSSFLIPLETLRKVWTSIPPSSLSSSLTSTQTITPANTSQILQKVEATLTNVDDSLLPALESYAAVNISLYQSSTAETWQKKRGVIGMVENEMVRRYGCLFEMSGENGNSNSRNSNDVTMGSQPTSSLGSDSFSGSGSGNENWEPMSEFIRRVEMKVIGEAGVYDDDDVEEEEEEAEVEVEEKMDIMDVDVAVPSSRPTLSPMMPPLERVNTFEVVKSVIDEALVAVEEGGRVEVPERVEEPEQPKTEPKPKPEFQQPQAISIAQKPSKPNADLSKSNGSASLASFNDGHLSSSSSDEDSDDMNNNQGLVLNSYDDVVLSQNEEEVEVENSNSNSNKKRRMNTTPTKSDENSPPTPPNQTTTATTTTSTT